MKKTIIIFLIILNILLSTPIKAVEKENIFDNITIVIDPGHGGKDVGTSYKNIYEKDINLSIAKYLQKEFEKYGAFIILTREGDYDLSIPNAKFRKKSDFDNRIKIIDDSNADLVISIHQNYYKNSKYGGTQIFYKNNEPLAKYLQNKINPKRQVMKISSTLYMYNKIENNVLLLECGFISNAEDRKNLTNKSYQKSYSKKIVLSIKEYFKKK